MTYSGTSRLRKLNALQRRLQSLQPPAVEPPPALLFKVYGTDECLRWQPTASGSFYALQPSHRAIEKHEQVVTLLPHQAAFIADRKTDELALVGGFGSGKSRALVLRSIILACEQPGCIGLVIAPTHRMGSDVLQPLYHQVLEELGLRYIARKHPLPAFQLPQFNSTILLRSGDAPDRLRGMSVHYAAVDELDVIDPEHARNLWAIAASRVRQGRYQSLFTSTTPEGFGFAYENWVEKSTDRKTLIKARTQSNPFLPDSYIAALRSIYPADALAAYLDGEFVALNRGRVYPRFDRHLNSSSLTADAADVLHVGLDFNVTNTNAVICIKRPGREVHVIDEITRMYDTQAMIDELLRRYPGHHAAKRIVVHPDASGGNRSTNAPTTDLQLLRRAGLKVDAPSKNPQVRDRVSAMNAAVLDGTGTRRLYVAPQCSGLLKSLEQQVYVDGAPDKASGLDHLADACGYALWQMGHFAYADYGKPVKSIRLY